MANAVQLGVAPLSAITTRPDEFIRAAHAAGFSSVGLRLMAVSDTDVPVPTDTRSAGFLRVQEALNDTGVEVADIEVLSVTPERRREEWLPMLEAGSTLGASLLNVVCDDPSLDRFAETLAQITADANAHGMQPVLEPVAYRPLNSFARAFEIARQVGCAVELDALHFLRTGADVAMVAENADIIPIFQLCDAPATIAEHADVLRALAADDSDTALAIAESRAHRLLPGEGAVPIRPLLELLPAARISVEVPNTGLRGVRTARDYLALLHSAATSYLDSAVPERQHVG